MDPQSRGTRGVVEYEGECEKAACRQTPRLDEKPWSEPRGRGTVQRRSAPREGNGLTMNWRTLSITACFVLLLAGCTMHTHAEFHAGSSSGRGTGAGAEQPKQPEQEASAPEQSNDGRDVVRVVRTEADPEPAGDASERTAEPDRGAQPAEGARRTHRVRRVSGEGSGTTASGGGSSGDAASGEPSVSARAPEGALRPAAEGKAEAAADAPTEPASNDGAASESPSAAAPSPGEKRPQKREGEPHYSRHPRKKQGDKNPEKGSASGQKEGDPPPAASKRER